MAISATKSLHKNNLMHQQADFFFLEHKTCLIQHKQAPYAPWLSDYCLQYFSITWAEIPKRTYAQRQT